MPAIDALPEIEALLCCIHSEQTDRVKRRLQELLDRGLDWERLFSAATDHQIMPLLYRSLVRACPEIVPGDILQRILESSRNNARRSLFLTAKLIHLLEVFQAHGISAIALKGPILAETLYGDLTLREFDDLDVLVRRQDVTAAVQLMHSEGYSLLSELAWAPQETVVEGTFELTFIQPCGTRVDLHWEVAPSDYPFRFDAEILRSSLQSLVIAGREVSVLSPESQLLFLCIHGAKHLWITLKWICDVARLVESSPQMDWSRALGQARRLGCAHVVLLGLCLAHELLDAPLPSDVLREVKEDALIKPLAAQVKRRLFQGTPKPEILEVVAFNAKMTESAWAKIRHFGGLLKAPTEADAAVLRLPPKLFFLYYPFRICRMIQKYGARFVGKR